MYFFLKSTRHRRFFLTLIIMAATMSTGQLTHSSSELSSNFYPARPRASAVDKALLGTEAVTECPTLPAPSSMSGVTDLNTVRSQMWIVNGTWWAAFSSGGVYFYKRSGNAFVKGALIESGDGKPDTLWNGTHLFIMIYKGNSSATFRKYSYNASSQTFTQLSGFPVNIPLNSASSITFAQDSQGKLWAAYTGASLAKVIWSTNADHNLWNTAGYTLATGLPTSGEIAAIVAFGGNKIGVAWSNQGIGEDGFRYHDDLAPETNWSPKELIDCCRFNPGGVADDHMNIKAAPDGRIFLVAKDSNLNAAGSGNGNLHLYVRSVADARVRSGSPTSNYGSRTDLRARRSTSSSTHESYLKFDLRTLGSGTVANARLRLYGWLESGSNGISTGVHSVSNSSWSETGINWNNRPAAATNALATTTITSTSGRYYEWDLTTHINSEKNAGRTTISIALKNPQTSSPEVLFNAREAGSNRPQLVVTMNASVAITSSSPPMAGLAVAQSGLGHQSVLFLIAERTTLAGPARSTTHLQVPNASSTQLLFSTNPQEISQITWRVK